VRPGPERPRAHVAGGELRPHSALATVARAEVYLHPGQLAVARAPTAIKTILGSCVAVCLWDEQRGVGGMNHFLLPYGSVKSEAPGRFGNGAIPRLIAAVRELGAEVATMRAKVFGGGAMIASTRPAVTCIGHKNSRVALELLELAGIPVIGRDLGGQRGRKIVFHTDTGSVSLWDL
jgi:chemotaxis protein CheD